MKLTLSIEVEHDLLPISTLLFALPDALDSVRVATSAGVQATGPLGMDVQVPGTQRLARVHFTLGFAETAERMPTASPSAAPDAARSE